MTTTQLIKQLDKIREKVRDAMNHNTHDTVNDILQSVCTDLLLLGTRYEMTTDIVEEEKPEREDKLEKTQE